MTADPHEVAIVVVRDFGDRLIALSRRLHTWICDTPANRAVATTIWDNVPSHNFESGVTTFKFAAEASAPELVDAIMVEVDLHHGEYSHDPPWSVIEVIGCPPTESLAAAFAAFGADLVSTGVDMFEARRQVSKES